jgi:hypothetical protein
MLSANNYLIHIWMALYVYMVDSDPNVRICSDRRGKSGEIVHYSMGSRTNILITTADEEPLVPLDDGVEALL